MQRRWELRKWAANKTKQVNVQMTTPETNDEKSSATNNSTSITKQSYYYKGWFKFAKGSNIKFEVIQRLVTK